MAIIERIKPESDISIMGDDIEDVLLRVYGGTIEL